MSVLDSVMLDRNSMAEAVLSPVLIHWNRKRWIPVPMVVPSEPMEWCITHAKRVIDPVL